METEDRRDMGEEVTGLTVDPERLIANIKTGIYVRAKSGDKWVTTDVANITSRSLLVWLRSRGGRNDWAEDCVGILLGHGPIATLRGEPEQDQTPSQSPEPQQE